MNKRPYSRLILPTLTLVLTLAVLTLLADEGQAANEPTEFRVYLRDQDLSVEPPTGSDFDQTEFLDTESEQYLGVWEQWFGSPLQLSAQADFLLYVETTDVVSIDFTLSYNYSVGKDYYELGEITGGRQAQFPELFFNGNYTIAGSDSTLPSTLLPTGSTLRVNISVTINWWDDTPNGDRNGRLFWDGDADEDNPVKESHINHEGRMVYIDQENVLTENIRRDLKEDYLTIETTISDAFGVGRNKGYDDLNQSSMTIRVEGLPGGGAFRDMELKAVSSSNLTLTATWYYQNNNVQSDTYTLVFSIKDVRDDEWTGEANVELEVDEHSLSIELSTGASDRKVGKGAAEHYIVVVTNTGNSFDWIMINVDYSDLPSSWTAEISATERGPYLIGAGNTTLATVTVTTSPTASSGSYGRVKITALSENGTEDSITVTTRVKTYGLSVTLPDGDKFPYNPTQVDQVEGIDFRVTVRNKGNARDTFSILANVENSLWAVAVYRGEETASSATLDAQQKETLTVNVRPALSNVNDGDETKVFVHVESVEDSGSTFKTVEATFVAEVDLDDVVNILFWEETLQVSPEKPGKGDKITFAIELYNEGGQPATAFDIQLREDKAGILDLVTIAQLNPAESIIVELEWAKASEGYKTFTFIIDPLLKLKGSEVNREDNTFLYVLTVEAAPSGDDDSGDDDDDSGLLPGAPASFSLLAVGLLALGLRRRHLA